MLTVTFVFTEKELDADFYRLDALIDAAADATAGFVGKDSWVERDGRRRSAVYYWDDRDALRRFSQHPLHLEAKRQYQRWYGGFHIVIAEVLSSYGDGGLTHTTPNQRARR